jgi:hypothetical protein
MKQFCMKQFCMKWSLVSVFMMANPAGRWVG